ncbi:arginine/serine-rich protein PNISR isoform X2 [Topomyia yanbarensis]|uniref:arginine/serine-rich protein PNISR isoform X2 n=1 Tax=Topomyia yanbarensis TaxID=2498891 RepID=UPI00273B17F1|nr:arginine/serine-rich protein PNISR isoform X2 [Topomyia yanbarensis]
MFGRSNSGGRGQNVSNITGRSAGGGTASIMAAMLPMAPVKNYQTSGSEAGPSGALVEGEWSSLNPSLYQNMSNDQVDWAALAQQWIQMKETLPANMVPAAPPPPIISDNYGSNSRESISDGVRSGTIDEQGEAPMEVERDEDHTAISNQQHQQAHVWDNGAAPWQYTAATEWQNPAWEAAWSTEPVNNASKKSSYETITVNPNASLAVANWQAKMARIYKIGESSSPGEIAGTVQPVSQHSQEQPSAPKRIPGLMDQVINLDQEQTNDTDLDEDTTQTMTDAKRKLLPAWIREGLEKMEREKQRQEEKEKEMRLREQMLAQRRQVELEALTELENARKKSKFESDSDDEEEEEARGGDTFADNQHREASPVPHRSREEILQELMVSVRRNLTEILLEVTNEEIALVAKETLAKACRKAQALRKTGFAALTGGLGLGIYGDSDEEDESESDNGPNDGAGSDTDDEEAERNLRNTIKLRQKEFEWTAREIEDQLAQEEAREERKRREYEQVQKEQQQQEHQQRGKDSDDDDYATGSGRTSAPNSATGNVHGGKFGPRDGETQPVNDKIYAYKLGRQRDKRISRFSDPKDTVRQTHITHVAIVNHKPGEIVQPLSVPKVTPPVQTPSTGTVAASAVNPSTATPLFPAAIAAAMHLEQYRRENSITSEAPSNASSSRASSSHRSDRGGNSSKSSHKSHKSKKHKRSRYSHSGDEEDYYDEDRDDDGYSQHSRRSHSSERSSYSRHRRSYSRDSRDDDRDRKYSYRSRDRSRSRDRYRSSRRSRSRSRSSSRRRH